MNLRWAHRGSLVTPALSKPPAASNPEPVLP
jgi:hypothetical protein